jgi:hypothetical protein
MNNSTDDFIKQAGKSNQKPVVDFDAFAGKRKHPGDEHNVTLEFAFKFVAVVCVIGFITYLNVGG